MFVLAGGETHRAGRNHGPGEIVAVAPGATATRTGRRAGTACNGDVVDGGHQPVVGPGTVEPDLTSDRAAGDAVTDRADFVPPSPAQPPSTAPQPSGRERRQ